MEEKPLRSWVPNHHPWRGRLIAGIFLFLLAFTGVGLTAINENRSWEYWRVLSCLFAIVSLSLSFYLRKKNQEPFLVTFRHEVFHWIGLVLSMGILSIIVKLGILPPFAASLQALILLFLATFLAGVYIEKTFFFVSALLGVFAVMLSYVSLYSYLLFIPISICILFSFIWFIRKKSDQTIEEER